MLVIQSIDKSINLYFTSAETKFVGSDDDFTFELLNKKFHY